MSFIQTLSGHHFDYRNISHDAICIEDIATGLSNTCRFAGQLPEFYSVAQHSVHVSQIVPPEFAFEALMHDAPEAWCNDGGCGIEYSSDLEEFDTRKDAIKNGFKITESDDFNIGVVDGGRLVSFDWMGKPVGESQETIQEIAEALGLGAVESKGAQS